MARDSWLKRLIWLRGAPAGGSGASYEKTVGPAPIISISDAKAKPAKSLVVGMEPIQDLHGYDSPWPAGGGKNLLPFDEVFEDGWTNTLNGITATYSKGYMRVTGTSTSTGWTNIVNEDGVWVSSAKAFGPGSYVMSDQLSIVCMIDGNQRANKSTSFTAETSVVVRGFYITVRAGDTVDWNIPMMFIRGTDRPTSYAPYTNICPITGRTGVTAWRTGVNLVEPYDNNLPYSQLGVTITKDGDGYKVVTSGATGYPFVRVGTIHGLKAGTYVTSAGAFPQGIGLRVIDRTVSPAKVYTNSNPFTVETDVSNELYVEITVTSSVIADGTYNILIQVEKGSTASAYEAYSGTTYPVSWQSEAGTVYGCTVDVVTGVLTVTDAQIASYNGETLPSTWISDRDVYAAGTTPTIGAQVVYKLETPQTYQLTPTQIQLLKGSNVLWSDADDLTLTYIGTTPANLLGGMLGGGFGGGYNPLAEQDPEELTEPEATDTDEPAEETLEEEGENNGE